MEEWDLDSLVFADEVEVNESIAEDTTAGYVDAEAEEGDDGDVSDESEDENSEQEAEEEQAELSEQEVDEDDDAPPAKTGDKHRDGTAHAAWKARQKAKEANARADKMERELAYLRGKIEAGFQLTQKQTDRMEEIEEELPEFDWKDPDESFNARYEALRKREIAKGNTIRAQQEEARYQQRLNTSVALMRRDFPDFDEVAEAFRQRSVTNPELATFLRDQPNPAKWAYEDQKAHEAAAARKHPDVEALEKEVQLLREQLDKKAKKPKRSLAGARGGGPKAKVEMEAQDEEEFFSSIFP